MPKGLAIPVGVNAFGGARIAQGDENDRKIVALGCGSDENDNAFQQDIGLGMDMLFDINDPMSRADIQARLSQLFDKFQRQLRYKLVTNTLKWTSTGDGELILEFKYVSMEADEERTFRRSFKAGRN